MHTVATDITPRTLSRHELDKAAALLTRAFENDPPSRWLWPERRVYLDAFPRFVRAFGGGAFDAGLAHATPNLAGVALWLPTGFSSDDDALGAVFADTVPPARRAAAESLFENMASFHPEGPHWHLPLIGVDPAMQGRGVGGFLLRHALASCDRAGVPAYLEATSARNAAFYERHGFRALGSIHDGGCPEIIPMLRPVPAAAVRPAPPVPRRTPG